MNKEIDYGIYKGIGRPIGKTDYRGDKIDVMPVYGLPQTSTRNKFLLIFFGCVAFILIVELMAIQAIQGIQRFYETRYFATHSIIRKEEGYKSFSLVFSLPVTIEEVENPGEIMRPVVVADKEVTKTEMEIEEIVRASTNPDAARMILDTFGVIHGPTMIAVATAESGMREDAFGINTNGTIDYGVLQINSVNWKIEGCSLKEIVHADKNIACAYKIWDRADGIEGNNKGSAQPWVAYTTGRFLAFLN